MCNIPNGARCDSLTTKVYEREDFECKFNGCLESKYAKITMEFGKITETDYVLSKKESDPFCCTLCHG